ncbi:hypothetical protein ABZV67_39975 [Streptomyces sp. NPDC005065]|uniref:hypothetical protein n=1 Tax=Streptomyces sp. NPDC005065 TaxID=3154461 RepID=UPI0033A2113C
MALRGNGTSDNHAARNEEGCIGQTLDEWPQVLNGVGLTSETSAKAIVIGDGSTDQTTAILQELAASAIR